MSEYLPYAGNHSIQEAIIGVHFQSAIDPSTARRIFNHVRIELKDQLPQNNEIHQQQIVIGQGNHKISAQNSQRPLFAGFEMIKLKGDGKPGQVLRLLGKDLSVNFLEYHRWEKTISASMKYLKAVLDSLDLTENPAASYSLRYVDQYTYNDDPQNAYAELLFRTGSAFLTPQSFNAGHLWHCNSGWFEKYMNESRILNQINIGSQITKGVGTVTLDHNAVCQFSALRKSVDHVFGAHENDGTSISEVLNYLHAKNHAAIKDLLVDEMLERIGIEI